MSTDSQPYSEHATHDLQSIRGCIFDMDGVLYVGKRVLPGVTDLFDTLKLRKIPFILATNNSMATPATYVERMKDMGVEVDEKHVQTSATATRDFLKDSPDYPDDAKILVVGMPALGEQLTTDSDFTLVSDDASATDADIVVGGLDLTFTYDKMQRAVNAIANGAKFVATNKDDRLPTETGFQPGAGAVLAGIERASRIAPIVVGKPEPLMMIKGVDLLGLDRQDVLMVGDRLDTDIAAAVRAGLRTALVLTGVSTREDLSTSDVLPDFVFDDLPSLQQALVGHG